MLNHSEELQNVQLYSFIWGHFSLRIPPHDPQLEFFFNKLDNKDSNKGSDFRCLHHNQLEQLDQALWLPERIITCSWRFYL